MAEVRTAITDYACGWHTKFTCCEKIETAFGSDDPVQVDLAQRALNVAAEILYALSGRQFGACEITVRPCRPDCSPCGDQGYDNSGYRWTPALSGGEWTNIACGGCGDGCSCCYVCETLLPGPIAAITEVKIDGAVLSPLEYRVDNARTLVRLTEGECWPTCQSMALADTEPGTWSVTYERGKPLPDAGEAALAELACELFKACTNDKSCCLPARTKSVNRQGISYDILDPMDFLPSGKTGIYLIDLWLQSVNPAGRSRTAAILSPDAPVVRQTTWPY